MLGKRWRRRRRVVRAAGGVVVRQGAVLLVHRPKYDDWTFPKGKADDGEADVDCALREVWEETGLRCVLGRELGPTRYRDSRGRPKVVRWWLMSVAGGEFAPNREVDEIRWALPAGAARLLSYDRDRPLLDCLRGELLGREAQGDPLADAAPGGRELDS